MGNGLETDVRIAKRNEKKKKKISFFSAKRDENTVDRIGNDDLTLFTVNRVLSQFNLKWLHP